MRNKTVCETRQFAKQVSSWAVNLRNKTVCKNLFNFSWIIGLQWFNWFQKWCGEKNVVILVRQALWYGRKIGFKDDGVWREDSPHDCYHVWKWGLLNYILETSCVDVNQACGLDGLMCCCCGHCCFNWGFKLLLDASAPHFILAVSLLYNSNCPYVILCNRTCIWSGYFISIIMHFGHAW